MKAERQMMLVLDLTAVLIGFGFPRGCRAEVTRFVTQLLKVYVPAPPQEDEYK